jgi:hypothetical protein
MSGSQSLELKIGAGKRKEKFFPINKLKEGISKHRNTDKIK